MDIAGLVQRKTDENGNGHILYLTDQLCSALEQDSSNGGKTKFLEDLGKLKTNVDHVDFLSETLKKYGIINQKFFKRDKKKNAEAVNIKEMGNGFYRDKNFPDALKAYTGALMYAEEPELIATLYANRSAVLFALGLVEECLVDIGRACAHKYPANKMPKLMLRKARASQLLRMTPNLFKAYEEPPQIPTTNKNPTIHCASNCVELKSDRNQSQTSVIATQDVQIGTVIAVEAPYEAIIGDAKLYHCHECFKLCYSPIPCDSCTQTLYCSEDCKENAFVEYHKYLCPLLLSLRNLFCENKQLGFLATKLALLNKTGEGFDQVLKVSRNVDDNEPVHARMVRALGAAFVFYLVENYTTRFDEPDQEEAAGGFKSLLMAYLHVRLADVEEVYFCNDCGVRSDSFASGIYPFYTMFRHSCCPNVVSVSHGMKRVLRAIRTIKKGEECFVSFGPSYQKQDRDERQHLLYKNYSFKCTCRACKEDWDKNPTLHVMSFPDMRFLFEKKFDLDYAKRSLPVKIQQVKELEQSEPNENLSLQEKVLRRFYELFANKRLIS